MPRNASGVYTLPAGNPVVPGTTIDAAWANNTLADMANEITNSLSRTGAGGMLAPFRIADGNVTAPGLSFLNETNSGLYRSAAGSLWMTLLGTNTMQFATTAVTVPNTRTFNAQGAALVGGTLGVTGAATFASTLAVTGAITATGGVLGNVTAASGTSTFTDVVITGSLDMTVGSSATITGLSTPTNASDAANKGYVDTQDALKLSLTGGTMSGAIAMGTNKITGLGTPTNDADAATKAYVDQVAQGLDVKASVRAATTTNITLSGAQTIDGVAVIAGDRVLVKNQSSSADNGIYVAAAGAWSRSTDANTWDKLVGAFVFVEDGSTNDNSGWVCAIPPGGTLGVTAVTWEQFSGAGQINAGTGMTKSGNTLNVNTASASRIVVGADEIDLAQTGVAAGTYKSVTVDLYGRVTAGTNPTTLAGYGITDAYTNTQTDTLLAGKLSLTGGTMSGALAMGTNRITGMGDPVNAQDAATKNYIDTIFGSTTSAAASAAAAASSASAASTSASNAASSASAASTSASNAATSLFNFRAQYLGPLASDPSVDGNGNPVTAGDLYWNTTANETRIYNGTAWVAAYVPGANYMDLTTNQTAAGVKTFSSNPILSGGTANGVAYLNGSKVLTTGSALTYSGGTFANDGAADGTNAITATGNTVGGFIALRPDGTNGQAIRIGGSGAGSNILRFLGSADAEYMRLTSAGLGIGATPSEKLTVAGTSPSVGVRDTGPGQASSLAFYTNAGALKGYFGSESGFMTFGLSSEQMRLTSTGLGIGTSSPATKLHVLGLSTLAGDVYFGASSATNSIGYFFNASSANRGQITYDGSGGTFRIESTYGGSGSYSPLTLWTGGSERLRIDSSGNLGIGTSSPTSKLHVVGTLANVNAISSITAGGVGGGNAVAGYGQYISVGQANNNTSFHALYAETNYLNTGTSYAAYFKNIGSASFGSYGLFAQTTQPDCNGPGTAYGGYFNVTTGSVGALGATYGLYVNNAATTGSSAYGLYVNSATGATATVPFAVAVGGTERARITAAGDFGLGTTTPTNSGGYSTLSLNGSTGGQLVFQTGGTYRQAIYSSSTDLNFYNQAAGNLAFFTNATERARITSGGQLLVKTTADNGVTCHFNGGANANIIRLTGSGTTNSGYIGMATDDFTISTGASILERMRITSGGNLLVGTTTDRGQAGISLIPNTSAGAGELTFNRASTTSTSYVVGFQNAGTTVGYIAYTNSTVTYNTGSDSRLKENVSPAPATGPIIDAIDIVQHDWKSGGHVDFSVVAQDLHQVYPQAVTPGDAGEEITQTWGVDYSKLVPLLVKEVQSLRTRVAQLEGA